MTTGPAEQPQDDEPARDAGISPGAEIARMVGAALAGSAAAGERFTEDAAEMEAITQAMVRLLVGVPLRSDGQLTIKALAEEAGLKRNKLTHKHTGLKNLFYALVRAQEFRPKIADDLTQRNTTMAKQLSALREERDNLKDQVRQLARIVHVLEVENHQLRTTADAVGVVRVLPTRAR